MKKDLDMSFLEHLEVFRWHLIRSIAAILIFSIISFLFKQIIFDTILLGPKEPDFFTYVVLCKISHYLGLGDVFCFYESPFSLININMSGQFYSHISTSIISGFILSFPYVFFELWSFIKPALYPNEVKKARGVVFFSSFLFISGVLFGYYVIAPLAINFLGSYQVSGLVLNQISLSSYVSTISTICLANGLVFELPIIVYFLTSSGLLTPEMMRMYRKHSMVAALILSAIITPPDIMSQILVSFPLIILYEFSIKISVYVINNKS